MSLRRPVGHPAGSTAAHSSRGRRSRRPRPSSPGRSARPPPTRRRRGRRPGRTGPRPRRPRRPARFVLPSGARPTCWAAPPTARQPPAPDTGPQRRFRPLRDVQSGCPAVACRSASPRRPTPARTRPTCLSQSSSACGTLSSSLSLSAKLSPDGGSKGGSTRNASPSSADSASVSVRGTSGAVVSRPERAWSAALFRALARSCTRSAWACSSAWFSISGTAPGMPNAAQASNASLSSAPSRNGKRLDRGVEGQDAGLHPIGVEPVCQHRGLGPGHRRGEVTAVESAAVDDQRANRSHDLGELRQREDVAPQAGSRSRTSVISPGKPGCAVRAA